MLRIYPLCFDMWSATLTTQANPVSLKIYRDSSQSLHKFNPELSAPKPKQLHNNYLFMWIFK